MRNLYSQLITYILFTVSYLWDLIGGAFAYAVTYFHLPKQGYEAVKPVKTRLITYNCRLDTAMYCQQLA